MFVMAIAALGCRAPAQTFDGERAMQLIREQCDLGPRIPGTEAHDLGRQWIVNQLESLGYHVWEQRFEVTLPLNGDRVTATNIWGIPSPDGPTAPALMLSAHWDTRPWADQEPGTIKPTLPGANDGGSGVAAALEIARQLASHPTSTSVVLAFWDAEDAGIQSDLDSWALGAQHASLNPPPWIDRVTLGINLDMVGGEDLYMRRETYSIESAPKAVEALWTIGRALSPRRFSGEAPILMVDDHLPWIHAGLPFVDMIGWPYAHWHRRSDSPENCSAESLQAVGLTVLHYIIGGEWRKHGRPVGGPPPASHLDIDVDSGVGEDVRS